MAVAAALVVGGAFAYVQRAYLYEAFDSRPLPPVETMDLESKAIGQIYRVYVQLPPGYESSKKRYPVMYAPDGGAGIGLYTGNLLPLMRRREIDETILVGIDYADRHREWTGGGFFDHRRVRDLTIAGTEQFGIRGEGDIYLRFLTEKVIPLIDARFRTDPARRSIGGFRLGARCAIYASVARPDVFNGCLAIDPGRGFEIEHVLTDLAETGRDQSRFYLTSVGDPGSLEKMTLLEFADVLAAHGFLDVKVMDAAAFTPQLGDAIAISIVEGFRYLHGT
jgi:uncharacterized protein